MNPKKSKLNTYILIGIFFLVITWLFVGIFRDDEFYQPELFIKHRATFKVNFYSPIGMQDIKLNELDSIKKNEEVAFQEFVINKDIQFKFKKRLSYLPLILIQLTLTFFSIGLFTNRKNVCLIKWQILKHFFICLIPTSLIIRFILTFDNQTFTIFGSLLILFVNYMSIIFLSKSKKHKNPKKL
jgi:hypothetical protein